MDKYDAKLVIMQTTLSNLNRNVNELANLFHIQNRMLRDLTTLMLQPHRIVDQTEEFLDTLMEMNLRQPKDKD